MPFTEIHDALLVVVDRLSWHAVWGTLRLVALCLDRKMQLILRLYLLNHQNSHKWPQSCSLGSSIRDSRTFHHNALDIELHQSVQAGTAINFQAQFRRCCIFVDTFTHFALAMAEIKRQNPDGELVPAGPGRLTSFLHRGGSQCQPSWIVEVIPRPVGRLTGPSPPSFPLFDCPGRQRSISAEVVADC